MPPIRAYTFIWKPPKRTNAIDSAAEAFDANFLELTEICWTTTRSREWFELISTCIHIIHMRFPETFQWDLQIYNIFNPPVWEKPVSDFALPGEWTFSNQITKQKEISSKTIEVNDYAPNGEGISTVTVTPYEVTVNYDYNQSAVHARRSGYRFHLYTGCKWQIYP